MPRYNQDTKLTKQAKEQAMRDMRDEFKHDYTGKKGLLLKYANGLI